MEFLKKRFRKFPAVLFIFLGLLWTVQAQTPRQQRQSRAKDKHNLSAREVAQKALPSVVLIIGYSKDGKSFSLGSGFFVQEKIVVTNFHVIENSSELAVKFVGEKTIYPVAQLINTDRNNDLAILKIEGDGRPPLALGNSSKIEVGDEIYAIGNPEGFEGTLSKGIISAIRQMAGKRYIQITAPISHGSSGGPVLNNRGEVIGVAVAFSKEGQNINFAIPSSYLISLVKSYIGNEFGSKTPREIKSPNSDVGAGSISSNNPTSAEEHFEQGNSYFEQHRFKEAIEAYKQAIRLKPDFAEAHYGLGMAYFGERFFPQAVEVLKKAIRLNPSDAYSHYGLGSSYYQLKYYSEALEAFKQTIRLNPKFAEAYLGLGNNYEKLGRYGEAVDSYKTSIRISPNDDQAHFGLGGTYIKLSLYNEAIDAYKQAIRIKPNDYFYHFALGSVYERLGRDAEAIEAFKQAIHLKPDDASSHFQLGIMYLIINDKASALSEYEILKRLNLELANELFNKIYK